MRHGNAFRAPSRVVQATADGRSASSVPLDRVSIPSVFYAHPANSCYVVPLQLAMSDERWQIAQAEFNADNFVSSYRVTSVKTDFVVTLRALLLFYK